MTLIRAARLQHKPQQKDQSVVTKSLNQKPTVAVVAAPPAKSSNDLLTEDGSVSQLRHLKGDKESRQEKINSIHSSQLLSTSRNDSVSQRLLQATHDNLSISNHGRKALDAEDLYLYQ